MNYDEYFNSSWEEIEEPQQDKPQEPTEEELWQKLKQEFFGSNMVVISSWGVINFCAEDIKKVKGGERLTYDEYLEAQRAEYVPRRTWFERCYYDRCICSLKGRISRMDHKKKKLCFDSICVFCEYDLECMEGVEDHVWMDIDGFEAFKVGDRVAFSAEPYMYLKTNPGKQICFGMRDPTDIEKIADYELPTEDDMLRQAIDRIICETCLFADHCYGFCIANEEAVDRQRALLYALAKGDIPQDE